MYELTLLAQIHDHCSDLVDICEQDSSLEKLLPVVNAIEERSDSLLVMFQRDFYNGTTQAY